MKVWFGCTSAKLLTYIDVYKAIRDYLVEKDCVILYDWLELAENRQRTSPGGHRDIKRIYRSVLDAIDNADICVIENTVPNFSVAHQISYSLTKQKPTLVLWQKKDNEIYTDSYLEAIDSKLLTIREYTSDTYKTIIDEFIGYSKIEFGQQRYNIILGNKQRYFLDWASTTYKKSRSLIIRDALDLVSEADQEFRKYLK